MATALGIVAGGLLVKKLIKKFNGDSEPVHQLQLPGYVGESVKYVDTRPWTNAYNTDAIYQYFRQASLLQCLSMLVDGVYSRDRGAMDIPLLAPLEGEYKEDVRTEEYTKWFWTRMGEIPDEEERKLGLKHYLQVVPNNLHNECHNKYRLVIALRGTKLSSLRDLVDDIKVAHHTLHCSTRYKATQALIERITDTFVKNYNGKVAEICITGHSLGAAIALLIGKDLAKEERKRYDVHCFNPPLLSVLMLIQKFTLYESIKSSLQRCAKLAPVFRAGSVTKHLGKLTLAFMLCDRAKLLEEFCHFRSLVNWKPVLYVNKGDVICKEYQRFYNWKYRCNLGLPIHMQALVSRIVKRNAKYSCLVPSLEMYVSQRDNQCHELKQWYTDPTLKFEFQEYHLLQDVNFENPNVNIEAVIYHIVNNAILQIAETHQGGQILNSPLLNQTPGNSSYWATSSLHFPAAEGSSYAATNSFAYQPAEYSAYPATLSFSYQGGKGLDFQGANALPHPAMEYCGFTATQSLLHERTIYSGCRAVDSSLSVQTAFDADFDYDEEISHDSADQIVLSSDSALPNHDPYMQHGGNMHADVPLLEMGSSTLVTLEGNWSVLNGLQHF